MKGNPCACSPRIFPRSTEITTDKSVPIGWHGEFDATGGSFDHLSGTAGISFSNAKDRFSARASGLHSDRYLDPPVSRNYTNEGNSGGILAQYEHEFGTNDRLRVTFLHARPTKYSAGASSVAGDYAFVVRRGHAI